MRGSAPGFRGDRLKRLVKGLAQRAASAVAPLWLRSRPESLLVLMYHRVLPRGHRERDNEQAGMYVSPETLRMHIEVLARHFTLMHLDEWMRTKAAGAKLPRLSCALTFDDGWLDNYEHAFPVLRGAAAPATIYLVSDLVGTRYAFWPNRMVRLLKSPGGRRALQERAGGLAALVAEQGWGGDADLPPALEQIDAFISRCKRAYSDAQIDAMLAEVESHQPSPPGGGRDLMNWDEIREMQASGLVRFGSHSRHHVRLLDSLPPQTLHDEVVRSAAVIEKEIGVRPATFCYPNGDHCAAAVDLVRQQYLAATTTARGWNSRATDVHLLNRVGLHDDVSSTPAAFLSRIIGFG